MSEHMTVELRCSRNPDGKYNAKTYVNGKELKGKEFSVIRGDQFSLVLVYHQIKKQYAAAAVQIKGVDRNTELSILHSSL